MRYSIEPKDRIYLKGYGFLSFAKNMGTHLSSKYGRKLIDDKIADKITSVSKKSSAKLRSQNNEANDESEAPKERYISPEKRQQIIDELRLV